MTRWLSSETHHFPNSSLAIERVFELGFMPFCQLYQPDETKVYSLEWRQVRAKWSRPAAYMRRGA